MAKRILDITIVLVLLPVLLPVIALLGVAALVAQGRPVLFRQVRAGHGGRPFVLVKIRTMSEQKDGVPLGADEARLTGFGRIVRTTSLDELPEVWNVLRGEMSLVGPRPLPMTYLSRYTPEESRRHEVRPGITGWAQINGRNAVDWDERLALDVWYVDHRSLWLDVRILAVTIGTVMRRHGISARGVATMHELRPDLDDRR